MPSAAASSIGYIHSVDSCGTVDGPGIRFVVFTSGCPLRCQYCHNPDTGKLVDGKQRTVDELLDEIGTYHEFLNKAKGGLTVSGGEPLVQAKFVADLYDDYEVFAAARLPGMRSLYRRALRQADLITCISEPLRRRVQNGLGCRESAMQVMISRIAAYIVVMMNRH